VSAAPDDRILGLPPRQAARLCGAFYLYIIVAGIFAEMFVRATLVVAGDAAATAANIRANEWLFRAGFSAELLHIAFDVAIAAILYALFRPVDRGMALVAALMRVACDLVLAMSSITHFVALKALAGGAGLAAVPAEHLQAVALFALRLHGDGYAISLVFFGFACLALGWLVLRSSLLPRALGALMALAGACYLIDSFSHFLAPAFAASLVPWIFLPMFVAELSLALWLLIKGVR
jgi:hypothetical protein